MCKDVHFFTSCHLSFSSDQPAIPFCAIISVPSYPDKKFVSTECLLFVTLLSNLSKMSVCTKYMYDSCGSLLESGPEDLVRVPTMVNDALILPTTNQCNGGM